jgi:8-oxo-dGTP pyrophosphatase MutT (NUDIX family)
VSEADNYLADATILHPNSAAAAIILAPGGRYLLQLRDDKRGIFFPGCWGCFGGALDPTDASVEACLMREVKEELGLDLSLADIVYFSRFSFDFSFCGVGTIDRTFYEVRLGEKQIATLRLAEGSAFRVFAPADALSLSRITPYDAFALWAHANRSRLAPPVKDR